MAIELNWLRCDECDERYFVGAVMNPRNHKWRPIPLSEAPREVQGNFEVAEDQDLVEVFDADNQSLGNKPVVVYGAGIYRPHNPSHFLDDVHVQEDSEEHQPKQRIGNFKLAMDDD